MTTADLHTLTGAYAVHALSDEEREAFERHLADCEACAQETAELTATAARLGLAASDEPRPEMRDQVLRRITTVRQETPGRLHATQTVRAASGRRRLLSRWALAACLAAAASLGGVAAWQHERAADAVQQARQAERSNDRIATVLAAPDARTGSAELADGASGTVVVSAAQDRAVLVVSGMARPPQGKVYQLWFDDGGTMRAAGLMDAARSDQTVLLSGSVDGASGMGITVEPAGGSTEPTSAPVALMRLPA
ncbi:anti-sigma factor domain-containing protein [Streptomyces sp. NPDC088785]|uniref:anti-sigma factor n=1 Tax=Streptomyces sp. NPDC088785 TaxID=3365897 RepID=UPI00380F3205